MNFNTARFARTTSIVAMLLAGSSMAQANFLQNNKLSVGFETGTLTGGVSVKMPYSETMTLQGVAGLIGTLSSFTARGLYHFSELGDARAYGYGSVGLWTWGGNFAYRSETALGFGAGVGLDYDLQKSFPDLPALSVNGEIGANMVSFDNYTGYSSLAIGVGLHYRF